MTRHKNLGPLISVAVHLLIFMIPITLVVSKQYREIELFVLDEKPMQRSEQNNHPIVKKPDNQAYKPHKKDEDIETTVKDDSPLIMQDANEPLIKESPAILKAVPAQIQNAEPTKEVFVDFGTPQGPRFLQREMPQYPMLARRLGKEGRVLLRLTIDEKGNLMGVEVIEGADYGFTDAALEAVKKSTFLPANNNGKPVMSKALLPIKFNLRRD